MDNLVIVETLLHVYIFNYIVACFAHVGTIEAIETSNDTQQ
jgi:hypothetical protein